VTWKSSWWSFGRMLLIIFFSTMIQFWPVEFLTISQSSAWYLTRRLVV
jgi:hypothetical protein